LAAIDPSQNYATGQAKAAMRRLGLQAFCKHFQRNAVPMPSFSKECLGGFAGLQGVTIDPNEK
jgi:hypothetical protein